MYLLLDRPKTDAMRRETTARAGLLGLVVTLAVAGAAMPGAVAGPADNIDLGAPGRRPDPVRQQR